MNLNAGAFLPVDDHFCTPLKHLVLEECNITVPGLKNLLTLPKALEVLYLGQFGRGIHICVAVLMF